MPAAAVRPADPRARRVEAAVAAVERRLGVRFVRVRRVADRVRWLLRGRWPGSVGRVRDLVATRRPVTFDDKVLAKTARDRRRVLTTLCDKVAVREHVAALVGADVLVPVLAVVTDPVTVPWADLPREYVVKVSHGSGGVVLVTDLADPEARLPDVSVPPALTRHAVRPEHARLDDLVRVLSGWLGLAYNQHPSRVRQVGYRDVPRRVLVEAWMGADDGPAPDLKVHCFDGAPGAFTLIHRGRTLEAPRFRRFLLEDLDRLADAAGLDRPTLASMLDRSRTIARGHDLLRVDWLLSADGPRVGELTAYPGGGTMTYDGHPTLDPEAYAARMTALWRVPRRYGGPRVALRPTAGRAGVRTHRPGSARPPSAALR